MKKTHFFLGLAAMIMAGSASAEDLSPGMWEITMESRVPTESGWAPAPFALTQCVTASDSKDPSTLISAIATPGATGCKYTEKTYTGTTFQFVLDCSGSYALKTKGSVTFGPNNFTGTITATGNLDGNVTEFVNKVSAKRVGGC